MGKHVGKGSDWMRWKSSAISCPPRPRAQSHTTTIATKGFPLPTTKEWGEGKGEGQPKNVGAAETNPSPQPSPRSCLAGRGSDAPSEMVVVSRCAPARSESAHLLKRKFTKS